MRITVFGATGHIGGEMVKQAAAAGHTVTAVVRSGLADPPDGVEVAVVPDVTEVEALLPVVEGADAVLSGIGPRGPRQVRVASSTGAAILRALEKTGVRRFVAVSAAPLAPVPPGDSLRNRLMYPVVGRLLRGIYDDLRRLEDLVRASDTDWTIVRPPNLTNQPLSRAYRVALDANLPRGGSIGRADVAHCMLSTLDDPALVGHALGVAR